MFDFTSTKNNAEERPQGAFCKPKTLKCHIKSNHNNMDGKPRGLLTGS